jgi:DNA mismatch repair ATPase MutS
MVFVSTHDVELSALLAEEYELYHFAETIENDEFHFDHKLKAGPLKTSNAIKILEMYNYPAEIIEEAESISRTLSVTSKQRV